MKIIKQTYFSLIELLVTISLLLIVISLLQPSLQKMIQASDSLKCQKNLSTLGVAYQTYVEEYNGWMPLLGRNRVNYELAPYLNMELPDNYNQEYMTHKVNVMDTVWECPSNKVQENLFNVPDSFGGYAANHSYLGYLINSNTRGRKHINSATKPKDTIVLGDGADETNIYWHLRYFMLGSDQASYKYNRHFDKMNSLWLDGSVTHQYWQTVYHGTKGDKRYYFKLSK